MRDPQRIDRILNTIREAWAKEPDSRLGQLLCNAVRSQSKIDDLFSIEDSELENYVSKWSENRVLTTMTDEDYIQYLELHDDHENGEFPPDRIYKKEIARFNIFVADLENKGVILDGRPDSKAQDASFHSKVSIDGSSLVFSNFGSMIAFYDDESIGPPTLKTVQELAIQHGYVFIPSKFLHRKYTHPNPEITCISDWWIRFFDYL